MSAHPTDPPALVRAARRLGRLAAFGLLDDAEIEHALALAAPAAGTRMRAMHIFHDSRDHHRHRRDFAGRRLRAALWPAIGAWRPAAEILGIADAHDGADFARGEARAIAAAMAQTRLRRA